MPINKDILKETERHIIKYDLEISPEELFIEFENIVKLHEQFEGHVRELAIYNKLYQMERNQRLKEKRRLFAEWYVQKNQNSKLLKEMLFDLSEMVFTSTRTVEKDLYSETTE